MSALQFPSKKKRRRKNQNRNQIELPLPKPASWGGKRKGSGPRRRSGLPRVTHKRRPRFNGARYPVHVTWRMKPDLPNLRQTPINQILLRALGKAMDRFGTRITTYSFQDNHVHMIVEATSAEHLGKAMQGLGVRIAKRTNRALGRRGAVVDDHYHGNIIRTPTQMLFTLVYVLNNRRHHLAQFGLRMASGMADVWSSARSFRGWREGPLIPPDLPSGQPVMPPRTWLLREGWKRAGTTSIDDIPGRHRDFDFRSDEYAELDLMCELDDATLDASEMVPNG